MSEPIDAPDQIKPPPPPWDGEKEITESQLKFITLRFSREDYKRVLIAIKDYGGITLIPDP